MGSWGKVEASTVEVDGLDLQTGRTGTLRPVHLPAHAPDTVGGVHGPLHAGFLAGHSDFATTERYVHARAETVRAAMERARAGLQRLSEQNKADAAAVQ